MNWHAGRNICYYSHFLTACAAWIGFCSWRKQLSGRSREIRGKTSMIVLCVWMKSNRNRTESISDDNLWVTTTAAWQLKQTLEGLCLFGLEPQQTNKKTKQAKGVKRQTRQACYSVLVKRNTPYVFMSFVQQLISSSCSIPAMWPLNLFIHKNANRQSSQPNVQYSQVLCLHEKNGHQA